MRIAVRAAVKKNGEQQEKTPSSSALAAAAAGGGAAGRARKKKFFFWNFSLNSGHHAGLIHRPWKSLTFGLPAAPRATFILARSTKMAIFKKGGGPGGGFLSGSPTYVLM